MDAILGNPPGHWPTKVNKSIADIFVIAQAIVDPDGARPPRNEEELRQSTDQLANVFHELSALQVPSAFAARRTVKMAIQTAPDGWLKVSEAAATNGLRDYEVVRFCISRTVESVGTERDRRVNPTSLSDFLRKRTGLK